MTPKTSTPVHLEVIVGSTRAGRFGPTVANWFVDHVEPRDDITLDVLDLAENRLPAHMSGEPEPQGAQALAAVGPRLDAADGFVVVTPEYNHSYPASLKIAIDWFAELHAVTVRDTVSFHGAAQLFDAAGRPEDPAPCGAAADRLLDQLAWWGRALRSARAERPYAA